jgi:hypothetical protein
MRHWLPPCFLLAAAIALSPATAGAALTEDDFFIKNAQDLVDVCSSPESDALNDAADHFCHGFVSGAWQYHEAQANGPDGLRLVCPPDPPPTRNEAIVGFVAWAGAHPQYMADPAVEALFRYLIEKSPCPKGGAK